MRRRLETGVPPQQLLRVTAPDQLAGPDRVGHRHVRVEPELLPRLKGALGVAARPDQHDRVAAVPEQADGAGIRSERRHGRVQHDVRGFLDGQLLGQRARELLEAGRPLLRAPLLGHVPSNDGRAGDVAVRPVERRDGQRHDDHGSVGPNALGLVVLDQLPCKNLGENLPLLPRAMGRDDERDRPADGLVGGVAVEPLGARVPRGDDPLAILAQDRILGRADDRLRVPELERV